MTTLTYGTVTGTFGDTLATEVVPITGNVTFTPVPAYLLSAETTPKATILPTPKTVALVDGAFTVELLGTDNAALNPLEWTYRVDFAIKVNGAFIQRAPINIAVPSGVTTDLADVTPVIASEGNAVVRGLQGIQGIQGLTGPQGQGVPSGGASLQIVRKNAGGTANEWATPDKSLVGLSNVDNTSDIDKPISTATQTALSGKAASAHSHNASDINAGTLADARLPQRLGITTLHINDWNQATSNGWYQGDNAVNSPAAAWCIGEVIVHASDWMTQTVFEFTTGVSADTKVWRRGMYAGTWAGWYRLQLSREEQDARYYKLPVKPSLTYSRATETAASTQLRTALVALDLVTDNTVA